MHIVLEVDGEPQELWLVRDGDKVSVEAGGRTVEAQVAWRGGALEVRVGGEVRRVEVPGPGRARIDGREVAFRVPFFAPGGAPGKHDEGPAGASRVKPPMPGRIASVRVREGDEVRQGQVLLVLEAMKMQNEVPAPRAGRVAKVHVREGDVVASGAPLVDLEG